LADFVGAESPRRMFVHRSGLLRMTYKPRVIWMPHLIIELPQGLAEVGQVEAMLDDVHRAAADTGLFEESHIRVRAIAVAHYRVGGVREPFIHAQCRIHVGRSEEQRKHLSEAVLSAIREQGWPAKVISVEVVEMDRASYAKYSG
jgi:5-carboxymethyl-2-hydroxymuconate isomerase